MKQALMNFFQLRGNFHKQVTVCGGIQVDEKLSVLIPLLWANGYHTQYSCENLKRWDTKNHAQIIFNDFTKATEIASFLINHTEGNFRTEKDTKISVNPMPYFEYQDGRYVDDFSRVRGELIFPNSEILILTKLLYEKLESNSN